MKKKFEDLVETVENSFLTRGVSVVKMQRSIKHIPISLKLRLGQGFMEHASRIFKADSIAAIFHFLSFLWDYLNPGLLDFMVERFGCSKDIALMRAYLEELEMFRRRVKVGEEEAIASLEGEAKKKDATLEGEMKDKEDSIIRLQEDVKELSGREDTITSLDSLRPAKRSKP